MSNSNNILTNKINDLLKEFFTALQLKEINETFQSISQPTHQPSTRQIDISAENINRRMFIDGVITYAMINLAEDVYPKLLLELAKLLADSEEINLAEEILHISMGKVRSKSYYAESLLVIADIFIRKAYWDKSYILIDQAKEIFAKRDDKHGLAKCENLYGIIYGERGDLKKSREYFLCSRDLLQNTTNTKLSAQVEMNLGIIENIFGNFSNAEKHFLDALHKFEALNEQKQVAELKHNLGMFYVEQQDYKKAIEEFDKGIAISLRKNYKTILAISYLGKANALLCLGNYNDASEYTNKAMDTAIIIEDKHTIADVYRITGILERKLKYYDTAEKYFQISLRLNTELNNKLNHAETSFELGLLNSEIGNENEKNYWLKESLKYYTDINVKHKIKIIDEMLQTELN
jgi:tetratricopeptide (TPR) repeat protein